MLQDVDWACGQVGLKGISVRRLGRSLYPVVKQTRQSAACMSPYIANDTLSYIRPAPGPPSLSSTSLWRAISWRRARPRRLSQTAEHPGRSEAFRIAPSSLRDRSSQQQPSSAGSRYILL